MTLKGKIKLAILCLAVALALVVILQNQSTVETHFLFATLKMPLIFLLSGTFFCGLLAGIFAFWLVSSIRSARKEARKKAEEAETPDSE